MIPTKDEVRECLLTLIQNDPVSAKVASDLFKRYHDHAQTLAKVTPTATEDATKVNMTKPCATRHTRGSLPKWLLSLPLYKKVLAHNSRVPSIRQAVYNTLRDTHPTIRYDIQPFNDELHYVERVQ